MARRARRPRALTRLTATLVEEVLGYHWLPLSSYLLSYKTIGAAIERFASPALVEQLLPPIARGELVFCQGFSEPGAGSDLGSLTTRAELRGDTYVVTGHKIWTSSAQLADWIYLAVRTDARREAPRHLRARLPGGHAGDRGAHVPDARRRHLCETFLDGVEIPAANLVGELERRLGRAHVHARLRTGDGGEDRRRRLGARRASRSGCARPDGSTRRRAAGCCGCAASSRRPGCSRSAPPTRSTGACPAAPPRRWRSSPARA